MSASTRSVLTLKQRWAYSLPALALALPTLPLYILLPVFYAEATPLTLVQVGGWLMLSRMFDVVSDGMAARWCDRPLGRLGRKGWVVMGALLAAPGLWGLSNPAEKAGGFWLLGFSMLLYFGWTLIQIPYTAWLVSLASTPAERLRLSSSREALGMVGLVLSALWPALGGWLGWSAEQIFRYLALSVLFCGGLSLLWMLRVLPQPVAQETNLNWSALFSLAPQRRLLLVWWLNGMANAIAAVLFPLIISSWLLLPEQNRGEYLLLYFSAAFLALPLWRRLAERTLQTRLWCLAMLLAMAAFALLPILAASTQVYSLVVLVTGATLGADLALPHSIQAAVVSWEQRRYGRLQPALHYAGASLVVKLSLGLGVGLAPLLLSFAGWQDGSPDQTDSARWALVVIYSWVPCVLKGMAVAVMWRFPELKPLPGRPSENHSDI